MLQVPEIRWTEVDGVTAVWTDVPGPMRAGLVLRAGLADETLVTHGTAHLVEHLAFQGTGRPGDRTDGCVGTTTTEFTVEGDAAEVVRFLDTVTRNLLSPPVDRLAAEREVLRAEAAARPDQVLDMLMIWRYGARSYGLAALPELALDKIGDDDLLAWSRRYAVRQNAVLWLTGPPPAGLRLQLADGAWQAPPDPLRTVLPSLPGWFAAPAGGALLHSVVTRSAALAALEHVLAGRLFDELRQRLALAYSPWVRTEPATGDHAHLLLATDVVPGRDEDAVRAFLGILRAVATGQVYPQDLAGWHAERSRRADDPQAPAATVVACAEDWLLGHPSPRPEDQAGQAAAVTEDDVVRAAQEALRAALAALPVGSVPPADWSEAPANAHPPLEPFTGGRFRHLEAPAVPDRLTVAPEGVMLDRTAHGVTSTVPAGHVAALLTWPDGRRVVIGDDGVQVDVEPTLWFEGARASQLLDEVVPAELHLPQPSRPDDEIPRLAQPLSFWGRYQPEILHLLVLAAFFVAFGTALELRHPGWAFAAFPVYLIAIRPLNRRIRRRKYLQTLTAPH